MKKRLVGLFWSFFLANFLLAQSINLKHLCDANFIRGGAGSVQLKGNLYTLDFYNTLHKTNLSTGETMRLGKEMFIDVRFFFGVNNRLFIIYRNQSLIEVDISNGKFHNIHPPFSWQYISWVVPVGKNLYTIKQGNLCHHPTLRPDSSKIIGRPDFFNIKMLLLTDSTLHTLFDDKLYQISLQTGNWRLIKKEKNFRNYRTGAVIGDRFFYVRQYGGLVELNMGTGEIKVHDNSEFLKPVMLFQDSGKLYYINADYKLFEVIREPVPRRAF